MSHLKQGTFQTIENRRLKSFKLTPKSPEATPPYYLCVVKGDRDIKIGHSNFHSISKNHFFLSKTDGQTS